MKNGDFIPIGNEKFSYDEEKAKELSWYYRNKK